METRSAICRLYALRANEPTRVEYALVCSQNALMEQSCGEREGLHHRHGWGVVADPDFALRFAPLMPAGQAMVV